MVTIHKSGFVKTTNCKTFIRHEPMVDYSIIKEKRQRNNFGAHMSMSIHKRPIEKNVDRFTDRLQSEQKRVKLMHCTMPTERFLIGISLSKASKVIRLK